MNIAVLTNQQLVKTCQDVRQSITDDERKLQAYDNTEAKDDTDSAATSRAELAKKIEQEKDTLSFLWRAVDKRRDEGFLIMVNGQIYERYTAQHLPDGSPNPGFHPWARQPGPSYFTTLNATQPAVPPPGIPPFQLKAALPYNHMRNLARLSPEDALRQQQKQQEILQLELQLRQRNATVPPLPEAQFVTAWTGFAHRNRIPVDENFLTIDGRRISLAQLHFAVASFGGADTVTQRGMWQFVGGRMGWVDSNSDQGLPRCAPATAERIKQVYAHCIAHFDQIYRRDWYLETIFRQKARVDIHDVPSNALSNLVAHANVPEATLRAAHAPETFIALVEVSREKLQRLAALAQEQQMSRQNLEQSRGQTLGAGNTNQAPQSASSHTPTPEGASAPSYPSPSVQPEPKEDDLHHDAPTTDCFIDPDGDREMKL